MTYIQTDILTLIAEGEALKEKGLQAAVDHANGNTPGWSDKIYSLFKEWLETKRSGYQFKTEDFRVWVELNDKIVTKASKRAYGFICPKAAKSGLIRSAGQTKVNNPTAHRCFASLWEKI